MSYTLTAELRAPEEKLETIRENKAIPAILYGIGLQENKQIRLNAKEFKGVYEGAGESQVVELTVDGGKHDIIVRDVQIDPITRVPIHVDLFAIDINQPVEVDLPLEFTGVAPAVKASGGSLMKSLDTLAIKCLPKNLVKSIQVPLEKLETLEDTITVGDLQIPEGIEVQSDQSEMVATVVPPRIETTPQTSASEAGEAAPGEKPTEEGSGGEEAKPEEAK